MFTVSASADITQNCTYIQNPGFNSVYTETTDLTYTVKKSANSEKEPEEFTSSF